MSVWLHWKEPSSESQMRDYIYYLLLERPPENIGDTQTPACSALPDLFHLINDFYLQMPFTFSFFLKQSNHLKSWYMYVVH